jgi:hypothetical protein
MSCPKPVTLNRKRERDVRKREGGGQGEKERGGGRERQKEKEASSFGNNMGRVFLFLHCKQVLLSVVLFRNIIKRLLYCKMNKGFVERTEDVCCAPFMQPPQRMHIASCYEAVLWL